MLMHHGFKRVRPLFGGLEAWLAAGYAVQLAAPDAPLAAPDAMRDVTKTPEFRSEPGPE
jgi:3-mercaptopyruvate sulfurtransferase SseA